MPAPALNYPEAHLDDLDAIRSDLIETLERIDVRSSVLLEVVSAVIEAVCNVLTHGYGRDPGWLSIEVQRRSQALYIRLADRAPIFDPTRLASPRVDIPLHQRPAGGFGVHMLRTFMDRVEHCPRPGGGNELSMIKEDAFP